MLLQIVAERLAYSHIDSAHHLVVSELRLGLPLELWLGYLNRYHGCEPFAEVVALDLDLGFLQQLRVFSVFLQRTC